MKTRWFLLTYLLLAFCSYSQVNLPGIFGDHMVIRRNRQVPVWGTMAGFMNYEL